MHYYQIGDLLVRSAIGLTSADAVPTSPGIADVEILLDDTDWAMLDAAPVGPVAGSTPQDFRFRAMPGLAFRMVAGRRIEVSRGPQVADPDLLLYLTGSAWGVLCYQRGWLPLHCSAVAAGPLRAVAFTGPSGAGKSTLTAGLVQRGWPQLCDDTCVIDPRDPRYIVRGAPKDMKLWRDALDALGLAAGRAIGDRLQRDKYYVTPPAGSVPAPAACGLDIVYLLGWSDDDSTSIQPIQGAQAVIELYRALYRPEWLQLLRDPASLFQEIGGIAQRVRLFRFERPRDFTQFGTALTLLEDHMRQQVGTQP